MSNESIGTLLMVIGLPGSGKSRLLDRLAPLLDVPPADDFFMHTPGEDFDPARSPHFEELVANLRAGRRCAAADILLCLEPKRAEFLEALHAAVPGLRVVTLCFENDPAVCIANVRMRQGPPGQLRLETDNILRLSADYSVPKDATLLMVQRG